MPLIRSADDGVGLALRDGGRGGRTVWAADPDRRFVYYYAHLDRRRAGLAPGTPLARGDTLGTLGTSRNADRSWPHLHFQVLLWPDDGRWWTGRPLDPRACLR